MRGLHSWRERASCTWDGRGKEHQPCKQLSVAQENTECAQRSFGVRLGHRALGVLVLHTQLSQWHKAGLQLELPSRVLPLRPPSSGGSTAETGMTLMNWRLTTVSNKWEFCPVITTVPQTLSSFLGSQLGRSESQGTCSSPGGAAKAHTKLWPTTPTSALSEKGLLSTSQMLWICKFPPETFYSSPTKLKWQWPRYKASGTHRSPSTFPYPHASSPFTGQASCICSSSGAGSWQPAPSVSSWHTPATPPFLQGFLAHSLACPPLPSLPKAASQSQELELGDPPSSLSAWLSISVQGNDFYPSHCFLFPAWFL